MSKVGYGQVIAVSGFRCLWSNQILLQLAYNTLNFALIIWVYKLTGSSFAVSALVLTVYLPTLLFIMLAGVMADILDKRKMIIVLNSLYAVSFLLFIPIKSYYPFILANAFFINSLAQFFMVAEGSSIPMLISKKYLIIANSLFSLTIYASFLVGFSISGPILSHIGIDAVFLLGSLLFLLALLLAYKLPTLKANRISRHSQKFLSDLSYQKRLICLDTVKAVLSLTIKEAGETLRVIKGKINLSVAITLLAVVNSVVGLLATVMPSYLETVLSIHAAESSYFLMIPLGSGTILGALLLGRFAHSIPRRKIVIPAIVAAGLIFLAVGFTPKLAEFVRASEFIQTKQKLRYVLQVPSVAGVFALGAFLIGLCSASLLITSQTVIQENVVDKIRGKIWSAVVLMMNAFSAVVVLLAGAASDIFGVTAVFIWLGIGMFVVGLIALKPALFFKEAHLPFKIREFLGLSHWTS